MDAATDTFRNTRVSAIPTFERWKRIVPPWTVTAMLAPTNAKRGSRVRFTHTSRAGSSPTFAKSTVAETMSPGTASNLSRRSVAFVTRGEMTTTARAVPPGGIIPPRAFVYSRVAVVVRTVPRGSPGRLRTPTS